MIKHYYLGIDIGGTFIKYAVVDEEYRTIEKWKVETIPLQSKNEFYDYLVANGRDVTAINAIGISAPGLIDEESNVKSYAAPNLRIMYGTNCNQEVSARTGKIVATINDAKAAGLCELKIGSAQNTSSSAFLIIGTGTGGCICNKENVIYGKDSFAGEFHNLPFIDFRDRSIKKQGDYSSMTALISLYNDKLDTSEKVLYGQEIIEKYLKGEKLALETIAEWTGNIAVQLLMIAVFYNPEMICIGGGISEYDWFIELLNRRFEDTCRTFFEGTSVISTEIRQCQYRNDANILGAVINVRGNVMNSNDSKMLND